MAATTRSVSPVVATLRPDRVDDGVVRPGLDVHARDARPLLREAQGDGLAEAHRGARDDRDLAVESGGWHWEASSRVRSRLEHSRSVAA